MFSNRAIKLYIGSEIKDKTLILLKWFPNAEIIVKEEEYEYRKHEKHI